MTTRGAGTTIVVAEVGLASALRDRGGFPVFQARKTAAIMRQG
jgi:hypothetical protein